MGYGTRYQATPTSSPGMWLMKTEVFMLNGSTPEAGFKSCIEHFFGGGGGGGYRCFTSIVYLSLWIILKYMRYNEIILGLF